MELNGANLNTLGIIKLHTFDLKLNLIEMSTEALVLGVIMDGSGPVFQVWQVASRGRSPNQKQIPISTRENIPILAQYPKQ